MTPVKNSFSPREHGVARISLRLICSVKIRVNPRPGSLRSAPGKRQQRNVPRLLDGGRQTPLVRCANAGQAPRNNLAALRHELGEQPDIFVVDGFNFLHAELADFLAAKIFAPTLAATGAARTWRTTLSSIGSRRTVASGWTISARGTVSNRTSVRCCCSDFFSHDAP